MDATYLERGLTAMARASSFQANDAHWGAAVIAAYYFQSEVELSDEAARHHTSQVDRLIHWKSELFEPLPMEEPIGELERIPKALAQNNEKLRAIGHNVIFSTLALRVLSDRADLRRPSIIKGIGSLVSLFDDAGPGRPLFGWSQEEIDALVEDTASETKEWQDDPSTLASFALEQFLSVGTICLGGHAGVVGHLLTHAESLIELQHLGYGEVARQGHSAYRSHAILGTRAFDYIREGQTPAQPDPKAPLSAEYWRQDLGQGRWRWAYGHLFKYPYSFFRLLNRVGDEGLKSDAREKLTFLM